jgi:hypothetical protein
MQQQRALLQIALLFKMKASTEEENETQKIPELVDCSLDRF